jgi:hypothetical protein
VEHHVGIAVPVEAALVGDPHPAEHQAPVGVLAERMDVEALSDAHRRRAGVSGLHGSSRQFARTSSIISSVCSSDFEIAAESSDTRI